MAEAKEFRFIYPEGMPYPEVKKSDDAIVFINIDGLGNVSFECNTEGLLHMARWFAIMALYNGEKGYHEHLTISDGDIDDMGFGEVVKEIVIYNLDYNQPPPVFEHDEDD